jgi:hypothetical protein
MVQLDDILAALLLSLVMLRRLEVKAASPEVNVHVPSDVLATWQKLALTAYNRVALASALKVILNQAWMRIAGGRVPNPAFWLVGLVLNLAWVVVLVLAWRGSTDARTLRSQHRIATRRTPLRPTPSRPTPLRPEEPQDGDPGTL